MKVRAVTRRYKSSCRVDPSRSDADGFQLLESVKVVAKRALGAIKLDTDSERKARLLGIAGKVRRMPRSGAHLHAWIFAPLDLCSNRERQFITQRQTNTVKMPSNRLTYVRPADMLNLVILTY